MSENSKAIANNISLVCAGNRTEDVLQAQCDALIGTICFSMPDTRHAKELLDGLVQDMKKEIDKHHAYYRSHLSESPTPHEGGDQA